ncbi:MAG: Nif3-like dinuclear metal center hexameric protein [Actinomycetota bacterium]|nr:Nif3-like dinuclear metal center hexameric protein [Actinomycetota bacterium]
MTSTVGRVVAGLERRSPPELASDWDAVGLVCGDPAASVSRVLFAVDPVMAVVDEAMATGADMIVTHHPLFLRGVHSVAPVTPKGRVVHTLIGHGIALYCAHTNADHARPGVSDALAAACGLTRTTAIDPPGGDVGTGRVGDLDAPATLGELAGRLVDALPVTEHGIRIAGDLDSPVRRVAVCGGAGDSLLEIVGDSADVYVTGDLRHHRAQDHLLTTGKALIDVPHWAAEWLWLPDAASALVADLGADSVATSVSAIDTSPWTAHLGRNQ